jgi:hydrogenase nickel incorporation protein HypB
MNAPRIVELRRHVLKKNDEQAAELRAAFAAVGIFVVNLVSGPGTGKTRLLEETLRRLRDRGARVAALVGDPETDNDAVRLARSGAPVRQIRTRGICHLEAAIVAGQLVGWNLADLDFLFIENVGNLVCTTSYDLGESLRVVLLSVTEGEDKPLKYPGLFYSADVAIVTKSDLAEACECDLTAARQNIQSVRPGMPILVTSAKTGEGVEEWIAFLHARRDAARDYPVRGRV